MNDQPKSEQERRKFVRLDLTENVVALNTEGQEIGRVEKVGAGGMQIRVSAKASLQAYKPGTHLQIRVIERNNVEQRFNVEVRVCDGDILGVQFLN